MPNQKKRPTPSYHPLVFFTKSVSIPGASNRFLSILKKHFKIFEINFLDSVKTILYFERGGSGPTFLGSRRLGGGEGACLKESLTI